MSSQESTNRKRVLRVSAAMVLVCAALLSAAPVAGAQISLYTAVDLAMRNNSKIHAAEADVAKAQAGLAQTKDIYIPNLMFGSSVGKFYGFPVGTPTLFNLTSQSLLFNFSQRDYIRSARAEVLASQLSLKQAQQDIEEDTALAYMDLDRAVKQQRALAEQLGYVDKLVEIVQARLDAGLEDKTELTRTRLNAANIGLKQIRNEGEIASLRDHLARATGLPVASLITEPDSVPLPPPGSVNASSITNVQPGVAAAFADAHGKLETAFGDAKQLYHPEVTFFAQYNYFSSIYNYSTYYNHFQASNESIGIQINFPMFDANRRAHARQSSAEAFRLENNARVARDQAAEGNLKLQHGYREQLAQIEVAKLQQELAQDQLDVVLLQLKSGQGRPGAPAPTPKDEQNARIEERQRYMDLLDMNFSLARTQLDLLKAGGNLEDWIKTATSGATVATPAPVPIKTPAR